MLYWCFNPFIYIQSEVLKTGISTLECKLIYSHAVVFVYTCVSGQAPFFGVEIPPHVVYFPKPHVNRNCGWGKKEVM